MRATFPNGAPKSSEYSHGIAKTNSTSKDHAARRIF
jgi:hypothetical protein